MDAATRAVIEAEIAQLEPLARPAEPPLGYGRDLRCADDLDARMSEVDPATAEAIAQDAYHAIITERGSIIDAPDFGLGSSVLLSSGKTPAELLALGGRIDQELSKDDRISTSQTTASLDLTGTLRISVAITPEDSDLRPFNLILALTDAEVLLQEMS